MHACAQAEQSLRQRFPRAAAAYDCRQAAPPDSDAENGAWADPTPPDSRTAHTHSSPPSTEHGPGAALRADSLKEPTDCAPEGQAAAMQPQQRLIDNRAVQGAPVGQTVAAAVACRPEGSKAEGACAPRACQRTFDASCPMGMCMNDSHVAPRPQENPYQRCPLLRRTGMPSRSPAQA